MSNERHETVADNVSVNHQFREVAKMIPHEEVDVSKMETTTPTREKSSAVGNAAAMREALENVRFYLPHFFQYMRLHCEDAESRRILRKNTGGCQRRHLRSAEELRCWHGGGAV